MFHPSYDLSLLHGADYNPRQIGEDAIDRLCHSLGTVGCAKPIIARGEVIVAGHQRTRALRKMGQTHGPVYLLESGASTYDEVRFNQLHNGTDLDFGDENARVTKSLEGVLGFLQVSPADLSGNTRSTGAVVRQQILELMRKYGPWGACVANQRGEIFHAAQYALACKIMNKPVLVFVVSDEVEAAARELLSAQYGVFSYDALPRNTYIQTLAQMFRLRGGKRENESPGYEGMIIPWLARNPTARVLDFGCGQGDYVKLLSAKGYRIQGMEFFRRAADGSSIDVAAVNQMADALVRELKAGGRFDAVVCDYVLNSVDSQQAENDVLNSLQAFCKPDGMIYFSGRSTAGIDKATAATIQTNKDRSRRRIEFLDHNGLTAIYRKGEWFYQKFHSKEDVATICGSRGWVPVSATYDTTAFNSFVKNAPLGDATAALDSIRREFNMPLNKAGRRLGRHLDVLGAIECLL